MCAYHADNGDMCAAGCLIPSNLYRPEMEQKPIQAIFQIWPDVAEHIGSENLDLLISLQSLHDSIDPVYWNADLDGVAYDWDLQS